jgi:hypothetical protein
VFKKPKPTPEELADIRQSRALAAFERHLSTWTKSTEGEKREIMATVVRSALKLDS